MKHPLLLVLLLLVLSPFATASMPLPPESVLQLTTVFTDQSGKTFQLSDRRGHVQVASMFYTSCTNTCPLMIDSVRGLEHALTPTERNELRVLLVTFDPQRDTRAVLDAVVVKRKLDPSRWTLARVDEAGVRMFAALLGVRYRKLADGDFNHTSGLILLDAQGRILARTDQLGVVPDPTFLLAVRAALDKPVTPIIR